MFTSASQFEYLYEVDDSGTVSEEYNELHVMDGRSRVARVKLKVGDPDEVRYNLEDHLGNAGFTLDASGSLINREEYFPFGETSFGSYSKKRYRFCGKERDEESGLYYYGARYYACWCCRFVSIDPLAGSMPFATPYSYAANNPVVLVDVDGLAPGGLTGDSGGGGEKTAPKVTNNVPVNPFLKNSDTEAMMRGNLQSTTPKNNPSATKTFGNGSKDAAVNLGMGIAALYVPQIAADQAIDYGTYVAQQASQGNAEPIWDIAVGILEPGVQEGEMVAKTVESGIDGDSYGLGYGLTMITFTAIMMFAGSRIKGNSPKISPTQSEIGAIVAESRELKLNLGGTNERSGFMDVNPHQNRVDSRFIMQTDPDILRKDIANFVGKNPAGYFGSGAEELPFPNNSVNEIHSNAIPSEIWNTYGLRITSEIVRVLKPGGTANILGPRGAHGMFPSGTVDAMELAGFKLNPNRTIANYQKPL